MATVCFASGPACACEASIKCPVVFEGAHTRKVVGGLGLGLFFGVLYIYQRNDFPQIKTCSSLPVGAGTSCWFPVLKNVQRPGQNNAPGQDGGDVMSGRSGRFCLTAGPVLRSHVYSICDICLNRHNRASRTGINAGTIDERLLN